MSSPTPTHPLWHRVLLGWGALIILAGCCGCLSMHELHFDLRYNVIPHALWWLVAWTSYIDRVLPRNTLDRQDMALGAAAALGLVVAARVCIAWIIPRLSAQPTAHPWRWSCALVAALALCFTGGLAVVAISEEVRWIQCAGMPLYLIIDNGNGRTQSKYTMKALDIALSSHHDDYTTLPPGGTFDPDGRQLHGWMARLLPYLGQGALFQQIDWQSSWRSPENRPVFTTRLVTFSMPYKVDQTAEGYMTAGYAGNTWIFGRETPMSLRDIRDGLTDTLLLGEIISQCPAWGDAANYRDPNLGLNCHPQGFGSPWTGGAQFLLCDGSVRSMSENIDPATLQALSTPDGGDTPGDY